MKNFEFSPCFRFSCRYFHTKPFAVNRTFCYLCIENVFRGKANHHHHYHHQPQQQKYVIYYETINCLLINLYPLFLPLSTIFIFCTVFVGVKIQFELGWLQMDYKIIDWTIDKMENMTWKIIHKHFISHRIELNGYVNGYAPNNNNSLMSIRLRQIYHSVKWPHRK